MVYSFEELKAISEVCLNMTFMYIDEIYYILVYDNKEFVSFASQGRIKERTILINGYRNHIP
jgi:aspartate aminotransferase